jgi:asparagine synthase (glutamine-hydrolysing)
MCGITGIYRYSDDLSERDKADLGLMVEALHKRGPDSHDMWNGARVALGHARLAIIDLSPGGAQPMHSASGRYTICFNGEIYNYKEIAHILSQEGVHFKTTSDTEVMLEAFSHWGIEKTLPKLNGMFAFALYDHVDQALYLARDYIGIKPLFWSKIDNGILFGSEIKALRNHHEFNNEINESALQDYFARSYISGETSIYKNCFRLAPGQYVRIDHRGVSKALSYVPEETFSQNIANLSYQEALNVFEQELYHALNRQMRADVPVAAFLSGGNDSALLCSMLATNENFKTYSVGYEETEYDESHRARQIADYLSLPHETLIISAKTTEQHISNIVNFYDEPFADSSALPTHMLSAHVKKHAKVALSGDGADELFCGYPRYQAAVREWQRLALIPACFRPYLGRCIPSSPPNWVNALASLALSDPGKSLPYIRQMLMDKSIFSYFQRQNYIGATASVLKINQTSSLEQSFYHGHDLLRSLLQYDQEHRLPDAMLTKVDRASMAASLEVRVPFLDNRIIALSRLLPSEYLVSPQGQTKRLIKGLLSKYLPSEIVNAPKTGFHIPMKKWLPTHFRDWACDLLAGDDDPYIDLAAARSIWKNYAEGGQENLFYGLWCILMYRQWAQKGL